MNVRDSLLRFALVAPLVILAAACTRQNSTYCDENTTCADPARPWCNKVTHECGAAPDGGSGCNTDNDCPDSTPRCTAEGTCTTCTPVTDNLLCQGRGNGTKPICSDTGACRACKEHSECTSGACLPNGKCAPDGEVAFVNNWGQSRTTCEADHPMRDGTKDYPYCEISEAIIAKKQYVVVAGTANDYAQVAIEDLNVWLLGPRDASKATISPSPTYTKSPVLVTSANASTEVVLDGFEITGVTSGAAGINCSDSTLKVTRSNIHGNTGAGVEATNCTVTLDANLVTSNTGSGVKISNSSTIPNVITITNNIIAANGNTNPGGTAGVELAGSGTFAFNTVAKNNNKNAAGGITCGTLSPTIENSIVSGNTMVANTQFSGSCQLMNVVGVDTLTSGDNHTDPTFISSTTDFHLKADTNNASCCIDRITSTPTTPNSDHDVDFDPRPQGAGWDIGADEVIR